jgi:hypothetical protein
LNPNFQTLKRRGTEEAEEGIAKIAGLPPQQAKKSGLPGAPVLPKNAKLKALPKSLNG